MASHLRAALAVLSCLAVASVGHAGDMCPAPPKRSPKPVAVVVPDGDHRIHIDSDDLQGDIDGHVLLKGNVKVTQDERSVAADSVDYDYGTGKLAVKGAVDFEDPKLGIKSDAGIYDAEGGAAFDEANFRIFERNGRGFAREMEMHPDGKVSLEQMRYTTCPVGNEDWMMQASSMNLDTVGQVGVGRDVLMRFKNVPIFYTPYISFPLGKERKTGLLFPSFGHSGTNGWNVQAPIYLNLAPNYDATVDLGYLSRRGVELGGEFRYLTKSSRGQIEFNGLPNDYQTHSDRSYVHVADTTDLRPGLRFDTDITSVSDSSYFEDFAVGSDQTSVTYLERRADLLYYDDAWRIRAQLQNFQTIDTGVDAGSRPYSRVPRVQATALYPILDSNFEFVLDSEVVNFLREVGPTGVRLNLSPEIRWSKRGPGYFFEPAVGFDFTQYDLQDATAGTPSTPTRSLPYARLDAGLIFERDAGKRTQTLEPRIVYSYVPYRNQNELPIFDSALPDLNLTELFRTNRYVGSDRIGDANQVALALTTRLFDTVSGTQYLAATIGQIRYFSIPRVGIPDNLALISDLNQQQFQMMTRAVNPLSVPGALMVRPGVPFLMNPGDYGYYGVQQPAAVAVPGYTNVLYPASDIVTEVALTGYKHVSVNLDYQWNPYTQSTEKSEISLQYRPDPSRVVNLGYRFQDGILKQWDGSFAWPIAGRFNTVGRWVYSIQDKQTIEQVAGFEYKSCCYRLQLVQRRYLTNRLGGLDTSIALQLELTGLSSVGKRADSFLERSIRGYSTRDPNTQQP